MKRNDLKFKRLTLGVAVVATTMALTACGSKTTSKTTTEKKESATQTETTEKITEKTTEKMEAVLEQESDRVVEILEDGTRIIKTELKDGEFANVIPGKYNGEFVQVGDYYFGLSQVNKIYENFDEYDKNEFDLGYKRIGDDEFKVIQHFKYGKVPVHYIYSDGKEVFYSYENFLCRYNIETQKLEKTDFYKTSKDIKKKNSVRIDIRSITNGKVFANFKVCDVNENKELIGDEKEPIDFVICYDMDTKEAKCVEVGKMIDQAFADYIITCSCKNYVFNKKSDDESEDRKYEYYVEKVTEDGLEEKEVIGLNSNAVEGNKVENKKLYFETNITEDEKGFTLSGYDKESGKLEKIADLKSDMFGEGLGTIFVSDVYDDYCEVHAYHEGESSVEYTVYKYTYATKAIEKIADED